jgi:Nucleotidyl transferase AbiEii toxin, Type IV TA system
MEVRRNCSLTDLDARERTVLSLLDRWPWELGGVVIGGYAVIAYGPPRYSNDVDIVIPSAAAPSVRNWLRTEGLKITKRSVPNLQNFEGQVERYRSSPITLDLLANAVRDRDAGVDVPESWISMRARKMKLVTLSGRTAIDVPVARPEALWALKLQAGRPRDISDLFAIAETPFDVGEVENLFRDLLSSTLVNKLHSVRSRLGLRKSYVDSLSRRGLGKPSDPGNIRRWERFVSTVNRIILPLEARRTSRPA